MKRPDASLAIKPSNAQSALYVLARQEYLEQTGGIVAQRNSWRLTAAAALAVAFLSVGAAAWDHGNNHAVPYVVEVSKLGESVAFGRLDAAKPLDQRVLRAQLAEWLSNVRSVYIDAQAEKQAILKAFAMTDNTSPASQRLKQWWTNNEPFKRAKDEVASVQVQSVLPAGGNAWRIEWCEDVHPRASAGGSCEPGANPAGANWLVTVNVSVNPSDKDAEIFKNPTGLYVESFDWQQRF